ncbi:GEVED domain-containing protein [Aequorivita marina]|uniref:GEVED domain-containing protein n=1 Tax=Aequorivita marina TaxID=3073654 RepID=UPI002876CA10|nr:GEVED domain-containing protein [Aequorivita sp. S2608]MDS1296799.1 GEVED domain-containing protein [Aequorivita sp. S2608]
MKTKTKTKFSIFRQFLPKSTVLTLLLFFGVAFAWQAEAQQYCTPEATNSDRYINSFTTTGGDQNVTNESSGFSPSGYGDFTAMTVSQGPGGVINFEANIEGGTAGFRIWVDWNQDEIFNTTDEVAFTSSGYLSTQTGSFSVPASALEGSTRMRIVSHWLSTSGDVDPCETGFTYGEFEDYTFEVLSGVAWDCPNLELNIGDPCDDGDPNTINDVVTQDCECEGVIPPDGMVCEAPIEIGSLPYATTDDTSNYEDDYSSTDMPPLAPDAVGNPSSNYLGGDDVVYSYTPTANGIVDISVTDHGSWAGVFVFTGCGPFESTVGGHTNSSSTLDLEVDGLLVEANETYYIVISTYASPQTTPYTLSVTATEFDCPNLELNIGDPCDDGDPNTVNDVVTENCECEGVPVATNDEACTATEIACGDEITQSLVGATSSMGDDCFGSGSADVWFTFTSDGSQQYTIAETSSFDAVVQLFEADDCNNLTEVGACQDSPENFEVSEAGTYYYRVRPYFSSDDEGDITVSLTCIVPGPGASCDDAIAVECNADPVTYTSIGSTATNTTTCSMGDAGLWFSFEGTGGDITVNSSADFDHKMSINSGACGDLTNIECIDDALSNGTETYTIEASTEGEMYYVYVAHWSSSSTTTGDITIDIDCADPVTCPEPFDLAVNDITENSAVFTWTANADQSDVYLVEAGEPAPDESSTPTHPEVLPGLILDNLTENTAYEVYVRADCGAFGGDDGVSDWAGPVAFTTLATPPDNDDCANAMPVPLGTDGVMGDNTAATPDGPAMDCAFVGDEVQNDVWFSFVAPADGDLTIETSSIPGSSLADTQIQVLDDCGGNVLACDEDGGVSLFSKIELACGEYTPGETYYVQVDGFSGSVGTFNLSVTSNNETCNACDAPTNLAVDVASPTFSTVSWSGNAADYEIAWGVSPYSPGDPGGSLFTTGGSTSYGVGTDPGTEYDVYVRAICDDINSDWASISFTSEEADCLAPSSTTIDAVTENSADISWTPANAADDHWEVSITTAGQSPDDGMIDEVFTDPSYTATGLDAATDYWVYVRTVCSSDALSDWFGGTPFTTDEADPDPCDDPFNDDAANSDVYISNIDIAGIGIDIGNPDFDFTYTSNSMSPDGYKVVTDPTVTVYPGLQGSYTVSSGPAGNSDQYYYSVWVDLNQDGCFVEADDELIITSNDVIWGGGIPNGAPGVTEVPMAWDTYAPGTYQARIRNSMIDHPLAEGNGDGEAIDFTIEVITEADAERLLGIGSQVFNSFTFYPNPVEDQLSLKANTPIEQVEVYNLIGQIVIQGQPNALETNLATDQLQAGVYLMKVTIDGNQKTFRVVKN